MLNTIDKTKLPEIASKHHLDLIVLFGSYTKGKSCPNDLDIAVRTTWNEFLRLSSSSNNRLEWEMNLIAFLETIIDLPYDIDLVILNDVCDSTFLFEVARSGELIYQREPTIFDQFRASASRRFDDDAKFRRWGWEYLKRRCLDAERSI
ncbi:nucleotidyltransferase domain-containing protein [bacterium]|nr:nucleotidyltransferase domain-containing protein [bacterium]